MTAPTGLTEASVVHVLPRMTAATDDRQLQLRLHGPFMAGWTTQAFMAVLQLESGAFVVIKVPDFPVTGVVAHAAIAAQPPLVFIRLPMTGDTRHRGILIL